MNGSIYFVAAIVLVCLVYLVLRRRSSRQAEDAPRARDVGSLSTGTPATADTDADLKPFRPTTPAGTKTGLPPRSMSPDSGSSHPAYPVAPAKYAGGPGKSALTSRPDYSPLDRSGASAAAHRHDVAAQVDSGTTAPPATKPWYPEAPADYMGDDGSVSSGEDVEGREPRPGEPGSTR